MPPHIADRRTKLACGRRKALIRPPQARHRIPRQCAMSFLLLPMVANSFGIVGRAMSGGDGSMGQATKKVANFFPHPQSALCESDGIMEALPIASATGHAVGQWAALDKGLQSTSDAACL